jgi:hypothetical protein
MRGNNAQEVAERVLSQTSLAGLQVRFEYDLSFTLPMNLNFICSSLKRKVQDSVLSK